MVQLLQSVPWFVIAAFAASAVLAVAAGRTQPDSPEAPGTGVAARAAGIVYAGSVAIVIILWIGEQF
jgi:hypothetical protein